jgi:chaperonin GroEL (HSP60 family)
MVIKRGLDKAVAAVVAEIKAIARLIRASRSRPLLQSLPPIQALAS